MGRVTGELLDGLVDLATGSRCVVCRRPGRGLCPPCVRLLPRHPRPAVPDPCPPGLLPVHAAGPYGGPDPAGVALRRCLLAFKEQGRAGVAGALGTLLGGACVAAYRTARAQGPLGVGPVLVVPVPSHRRVVRERGRDPLVMLARSAADHLRAHGVAARYARPVRVLGRPADQAGLDAAARAANVADRFAVGPRAPSRATPILVVDDVLTTGATVRAVQRALEEAGHTVLAAAVVGATPRRFGGFDYRGHRRGTSVRSWSPPGSVVASEEDSD